MIRTALTAALVGAASLARAQTPPDTVIRVEYDAVVDSTTRSVSAYAVIDTGRAPPDTFALELVQRWKGRGPAPVASLELGIGRTRAAGFRDSFLRPGVRRPDVVLLVPGARPVRLEQGEYVSNGGAVKTFETARYRVAPADLRRVADADTVRLRVGDRELWLDPGWRRVAAAMLAAQSP